MDARYLPLTWLDYHTLASKLAASILRQSPAFDIIVAVSRGGLTLGHLLTDLLRKPIATLAIQSYTDIQKQGEVVITEKLRTPVRGKRVLLVDDVADSGKTLKRAVSYLRHLGPADITTVAMFYKPHSQLRPDYYAKQTNKWIIFPYEATEMILLITASMQREGKTKADIQHLLETLGFSENQIAFVRRHWSS